MAEGLWRCRCGIGRPLWLRRCPMCGESGPSEPVPPVESWATWPVLAGLEALRDRVRSGALTGDTGAKQ